MKRLIIVLFIGAIALNGCSQDNSDNTAKVEIINKEYKVMKTEEEWREELSPEQYRILREKGTEPAFKGKYCNLKEKGVYLCAACGNELFSSDSKYDSGSGWPSFRASFSEGKVKTKTDNTLGMERVEVLCNRCGGHLGHVFDDGPQPTGKRYCVNSGSLDFKAE